MAKFLPNVTALRDVTIKQLEEHASGLDEVVYRRCRHVITENTRVLSAGDALERGDLDRFGELMGESHGSLRDDYEVSSEELDLMVEIAHKIEGVYGARMTGGGFGGCTVNLVADLHVEEFKRRVSREYERATSLKPEI